MFVLFVGSPESGKSMLANEVGRRLRWPVIGKGVVRDRLPDAIGGVAYEMKSNADELAKSLAYFAVRLATK